MNPSRILVVEDEGIVAMEIEERLMAMGYRLTGSAASGEQALELVRQERPDLVLMDIRLQGAMDGIAAAEEILRRFHLPVIFLTAYSEEATLERAKLAEPYGYLLKPFDDRELKSAIEIALYKHRAEAEIRRLNRLYEVLSQVNQAVVRINTREELLPIVCRLVVERGEIDLAWIGWLDEGTSRISPVTHFGKPSHILSETDFFADDRPEGQGNPGKAIREGQPFICNSCPQDVCLYPVAKQPAVFGFQSCASFPLRFQGQVCGALTLCAAEAGFFRKREIKLLEEVALDVSFALDKIESDAQRERLSEQFQQQSTFLQTLMDAMPYPIFYKDAGLRYLGCNTRFERFLGVKREQLIGKTAYDIWPRDLADIHHRVDQELLEDTPSQIQIYEGRIQAAEGVHNDVLTHKAMFQNPDGSVGGIIGAMEDITERKRSEEEMRESEARFRNLVEGAPEAIFVQSGGRFVYLNSAMVRLLGASKPEELLHKEYITQLAPEYHEAVRDRIALQCETGKPAPLMEQEYLRLDGSRVPVETTALAIRFQGNDAHLVFIRDITERRQAAAALRENEERLRLFIEYAPASLAMFDREMRYLSASRRWLSDYNLAERDLKGLSHYEVFPEIPEYWKTVHRRALAGEVVRADTDRFERVDGSVRWLRWEVRPWRNQAGEIAGIVIFSEDITARKQAEEALQESEERFRQAMEATSDGLWDWDLASGSVYYSPGYFRMLGYEPEESQAKTDTWLELVHPDDRERALAANEACIRNDSPSVNIEFRMRSSDGTWRWILGRGKATRRDAAGRALQMIGTHVDITERKQAEEEKEKLEAQLIQSQKIEAVGRLAGGVAHDFNNMLGVILGHTELVLEGTDPEGPHYLDLQEIQKAAHRSADLTRQLLAFARKQTISPKVLDLNETVSSMINMLRRLIGEDLDLAWMPGHDLWKVKVDPSQIDQILANLTVNARDAIAGVGKITIETGNVVFDDSYCAGHPGFAPGEYVLLAESDNGAGMSRDVREHLFEPFFTT